MDASAPGLSAPGPTSSSCVCTTASVAVSSTQTGGMAGNSSNCTPNVVTIPVPIVHNEDYYTYITVKGSLHDNSCTIFGLNDTEVQALSKRFDNSVKPAVNGIMVLAPPMTLVNTLAQLNYKVVCSCGEAEICWTMQREI